MNDFGLLIAYYNSTLPDLTLCDNSPHELQVDSSGRLIISGRYFEDSQHVSGDAGLFIMGVRDDGVASSVVYDTVTFTAVTPGADSNAIDLVFNGSDDIDTVVNAWNAANPNNQVSFSGQAGTYIPTSGTADLDGGADDTIFTDANYDYTPFATDKYGRLKVVADLDVDFDFIYAEDSVHNSGDLGSFQLSIRLDDLTADNSAQLAGTNGDYQGFFTNDKGELYVKDSDVLAQLVTIDSVLDAIKVDTGNIDVNIGDIETLISALSHSEDDTHVSGDNGIMGLAVRNDADTSLVDADGDYSPLQVNNVGRLKVTAVIEPNGTEDYVVTDALADGGDGLETITAAGTPWVTVASYANVAGQSAEIYGWQWAADANAVARLITDTDGTINVYKIDLNSSAQPGKSEHFADGGNIEIVGATNQIVKLQIRKRNAGCGDAQGSGSVHIRKM